MKNKLITILMLIVFTAISCKKTNYRKDAQIIGYDTTECNCCGGYMIRLTEGNSSKVYLAINLPSGSGINQASSFPITVEIDYKFRKDNCSNKFIEISRLRKK